MKRYLLQIACKRIKNNRKFMARILKNIKHFTCSPKCNFYFKSCRCKQFAFISLEVLKMFGKILINCNIIKIKAIYRRRILSENKKKYMAEIFYYPILLCYQNHFILYTDYQSGWSTLLKSLFKFDSIDESSNMELLFMHRII